MASYPLQVPTANLVTFLPQDTITSTHPTPALPLHPDKTCTTLCCSLCLPTSHQVPCHRQLVSQWHLAWPLITLELVSPPVQWNLQASQGDCLVHNHLLLQHFLMTHSLLHHKEHLTTNVTTVDRLTCQIVCFMYDKSCNIISIINRTAGTPLIRTPLNEDTQKVTCHKHINKRTEGTPPKGKCPWIEKWDSENG